MEPKNTKKDLYKLFEGDRKFRTLVENLPGIVFRCTNDPDRTMQFISNECEWVTGYSPTEFCTPNGINWGGIIHEMDREHVWNTIQKAVANKEKFHLKYRIWHRDKKVHWISETGIAVENKSGATFLEGYLQDISGQIIGGSMEVVKERALNEVQNGIIISNARLKGFPIIYVNKAFEKISGYTHDEVIGRNCNFLQCDDRQQKEIKTIRKALQTGSDCKVEIRNYRKNGDMFWNELSITPVRDLQDEISHFIGVQNDITQRKYLELLRKGKNDVLEMIIKKIPLEFILDTIREMVEEQFKMGNLFIHLYDPMEKKVHPVHRRKPKSIFIETMDSLLAEPVSSPVLRTIKSKKKLTVVDLSKDPFWQDHREMLEGSGLLSSCFYPLLDSANHSLGVFSLFPAQTFHQDPEREELLREMVNLSSMAIDQYRIQDQLKRNHDQLEENSKNLEKLVTQRSKDLKNALNELKEVNSELLVQISEVKASRKVAEMNEAILLAIAHEFPKGVILLVDEKMQVSFIKGEEFKELQIQMNYENTVAISDLEGLSPSEKSQLHHYTEKTLEGQHLSFEFEHQEKIYAVNTTPLLDENGRVSLALMVMFNISERKQNENIVFETLKKEKEFSNLKSRFISTASHEFRTPLGIILSSASLIEKLNGPDKEDRRMFHLERIKSNVQHLVTLLNDFLSLTKLEEGETKAAYEHFDLLQLSRSLIGEIQESNKKGQTIELKCTKPGMETYLDPKLVRHILLNLLSNAIKYSGEDKSIVLKIGEDQETTNIKVIDQGIGIPEEDQEHVFRRFFRARNSLDVPGTGLGLHIIKSYTELMRGEVTFKSIQNQGSSFELKFPKTPYHEKSIAH